MTPEVQQAIACEQALLDPAVRHSREQVERLLDPDFEEVGASGRLWTRAAMVEMLAAEPVRDVRGHDWRGRELAPGLVQVSYVSEAPPEEPGGPPRRARRTSLWRRTPQGWRVLHHQGTLVPG